MNLCVPCSPITPVAPLRLQEHMINIFTVYKNYPFKIPFRVRALNLFRLFFTISFFEQLLVSRVVNKKNSMWSKMIPPVYFYKRGTLRNAERNQLQFTLDISRLLDHSIYYNLVKDPAWDNLFRNIKEDAVIFDIGANIGFLTLNFARSCPQGLVFSFEPDSQNFESLQRNVKSNKFKNVKIFQKALGSRTETATLYKLYSNNPGANRILSKEPDQQHELEHVEVTSLDEIIAELAVSKIDLLKIDVEGFERFVLEGSKKVIEKWKPILFIELAEVNLAEHGLTAASLVNYVESLGYNVTDAKSMSVIDKLKTDYHTDILCFPQV